MHSWQQRKKWRVAKRAWRAEVKRYNERHLNKLHVFLGQRDLSEDIFDFTGQSIQDTVQSSIQNGFQVFEPLGLAYVDVTMQIYATHSLRLWLEHLFRLNQSHSLRVYRGEDLVYKMQVFITRIDLIATKSDLVRIAISLRSSGKVTHGQSPIRNGGDPRLISLA